MSKTFEIETIVSKHRLAKLYAQKDKDIQEIVKRYVQKIMDDHSDYCIKANADNFANTSMAVGFYFAFKEKGMSNQETIDRIANALYEGILPRKELMEKYCGKDIMWPLVRKVVPKVMTSANGHGFETEVLQTSKKECAFTVHQCIIATIMKEYDIPKELGTSFCHCDVISMGSIPSVRFVRTQTLANGDSCCDFRFIKE